METTSDLESSRFFIEKVLRKNQALAVTNPAEVEKTIKSLGPLQVEYNGKLYEDGKEIIVSNANKNINIKGLNSDSFSWSLNGTSGSSNPIVFESSLITSSTSLIITQGDRKITTYLKMLSKPNLVRVELIDEKHTNRKATSGEKLYLVGHGDFKATAIASQSEYKNGFQHPDLSWSTNNIDQKNSLNVFRKNFGNNEGTHLVRAEIADGMTYSADVVIVGLNKSDYEIYPPGTTAALKQVAEKTKSFIKIFKEYSGGKTIEPSFSLTFSGSQYNQEISKSPLYEHIREGGAKLGLGINANLPVPGLSITVPKVGSIGAYLDFGANVSLSTKLVYSKNVNTSSYKLTKNIFEFGANGDIEFGVKAETAVPNWIGQLTLKGYGKSGVYVSKTNYYDPLKPNEGFEFGFNPLVVGANAILTLGGIDIVNYKYEKTLLDKYQIWPKE